MENAAALIETGNTSPATLAPKVETTSVFKSFWPGRKASNVALNLEGESAMLFKIRQRPIIFVLRSFHSTSES